MLINFIKSKFVKKQKMSCDYKYFPKDTYVKIADFFKNNVITEDVVIVCIGSNRTYTIDCLGPFVGSILKEDKNFHIPVYGSLINPINATNLIKKITKVKNEHPNEVVIVIDAALSSDESKVGMIDIKKGSLKPGNGAGKDLGEVGDISIRAFVAPVNINVMEYGVDLNFISAMANIIVKGIKELN